MLMVTVMHPLAYVTDCWYIHFPPESWMDNANLHYARALVGGITEKYGDALLVLCELYWSPAILLQCEDHVHRVGQKANNVNISYVIGSNTIDEYLWPMINKKLENVGNALDGKNMK